MRRLVFGFILLSSLALANDKADSFMKSCRYSSMTTLTNIVKDAKEKYKQLDAFSTEKCSKLKDILDDMDLWGTLKDPKLEGCTRGVDAAVGMSPEDDNLRKKFKADLCL